MEHANTGFPGGNILRKAEGMILRTFDKKTATGHFDHAGKATQAASRGTHGIVLTQVAQEDLVPLRRFCPQQRSTQSQTRGQHRDGLGQTQAVHVQTAWLAERIIQARSA